MKKWYLVSVKPNQQRKSAVNLQQQDIETYTPQISFNDGHCIEVEPAFPTYVFACFDVETTSVASVNNTRGVNKLVSFSGGVPAIVQDDIISIMRDQFDEVEVDTRLKKGDSVIISEGPFAGFSAIFKAEDALTRAVLLIKLVNKTHEIAVGRNQVVRA